jgi:hypothetical protein
MSSGSRFGSFDDQIRALPRRQAVAQSLQARRDLARQHLDIARAEHAQGVARICHGLQSDRQSVFVQGAFGGHRIGGIESGKVETLAQHEHVGDKIPAAADSRHVMAARAGIGVRAGNPVHVAGKGQRLEGVGQGIARALGLRTPAAILAGPVRLEQGLAVPEQVLQRHFVFLAVLQMPGDRFFLSDGRRRHDAARLA